MYGEDVYEVDVEWVVGEDEGCLCYVEEEEVEGGGLGGDGGGEEVGGDWEGEEEVYGEDDEVFLMCCGVFWGWLVRVV